MFSHAKDPLITKAEDFGLFCGVIGRKKPYAVVRDGDLLAQFETKGLSKNKLSN